MAMLMIAVLVWHSEGLSVAKPVFRSLFTHKRLTDGKIPLLPPRPALKIYAINC